MAERKIVKRWSRVKSINGKEAVERSTGRLAWDEPFEASWSYEELRRDPRIDRGGLFLIADGKAGPPSWIDPEFFGNTGIVSAPARCKYATAHLIHDIEIEKLDPLRGSTSGEESLRLGFGRTHFRKYDAPASVQTDEAIARVISRAKRQLRDLPICTVTGEPVHIVSRVHLDEVAAAFLCTHCHAKYET